MTAEPEKLPANQPPRPSSAHTARNRRRARLAAAVSLAVHLAAATVIAAVASAVPLAVAAFGNPHALSITASFADESQPAAADETGGSATIVVMPTEAWQDDRHYVSTLAPMTDRAADVSARTEPRPPRILPRIPPEPGTARPISPAPPHPAHHNPPTPRRPAAPMQPAVAQVFLPPPDLRFVGRPCRYPEVARQALWQGTVELLITIAADGRVTHVSVYKSSGNGAADAEAVQTAQTWRAVPAKPGGKLWPCQVRKPIIFQL